MKVLIYGIAGTMGKIVYETCKNNPQIDGIVGVDKFANANDYTIPVYNDVNNVKESVDCIIDFSVKAALPDIINYSVKNNVPCVLCTTGYDKNDLALIEEASKKVAVFRSGNMSVGVNALVKLVSEAAKLLGLYSDVEIIEQHHNKKVDAPSGTAIMLADAVKSQIDGLNIINGREGQCGRRTKNEIGMHAVRGGTIVGKHEVMFIMNNEVVTLKHESENKGIFAEGAVKAAVWMANKPAGKYDMLDVLGLK
ncbi:MAG: 4-hydroxy-tetrahydrodipicolinate reductase [Clostridia bacterium]|nr:4-hydroxy-tetrahydrodipicolinate reductase [Clostridia bacterium]